MNRRKQILGIRFFDGTPVGAVAAGLRGGLVVVPSAPVLVDVAESPATREAVLGADLALPDSGLMVLLWKIIRRERIERVSGLEYLKLLLEELKRLDAGASKMSDASGNPIAHNPSPITQESPAVFWVMPSEAARDRNLAWLRRQGFGTSVDDCYVAPQYAREGRLADEALVEAVWQRRPAHIILALGGGVQERLGFALREELRAKSEAQTRAYKAEDGGALASVPRTSAAGSYRPGIHCIGAAIGFLNGEQVHIPMWVDYFYFGWLWRSVSAPRRFLPRYWRALRLVGLMLRYRERVPVGE